MQMYMSYTLRINNKAISQHLLLNDARKQIPKEPMKGQHCYHCIFGQKLAPW